jgi:hypothetical protein
MARLGNISRKLNILASWDTDQGGNKAINKRRGQHFLSLKKGARELAFATQVKAGWWWILTYDCSYCGAAETRSDAAKVLVGIKWQKWKKKKR